MPLIHSKKPSAFSKNVSAEMHAGKPQKQAVAIAYSVQRQAEHKKHAHGGMIENCKMCNMAEGGNVESGTQRRDNERGVNKASAHNPEGGRSETGMAVRSGDHGKMEIAKNRQRANLQHPTLDKSRPLQGLAEGGEVHERRTY